MNAICFIVLMLRLSTYTNSIYYEPVYINAPHIEYMLPYINKKGETLYTWIKAGDREFQIKESPKEVVDIIRAKCYQTKGEKQ